MKPTVECVEQEEAIRPKVADVTISVYANEDKNLIQKEIILEAFTQKKVGIAIFEVKNPDTPPCP